MHYPDAIRAIAQVIALLVTIGSASAHDEKKYPDLTGQWDRRFIPGLPGQTAHDQTKGWGPYQEAPLTPEYRKVMEDSMQVVAGLRTLAIRHARSGASGS